MHTLEHLSAIRAYELDEILKRLPPNAKLLEIGAGTGQQAKLISAKGFEVEAIEYAHPGFAKLRENREFPVKDYDGKSLPFEDNVFSCVFSSNVLEHIPHVEEFQSEIHRVLRDDGIAIHLMPTATWRIWTSLTHYLYFVKILWNKFFKTKTSATHVNRSAEQNNVSEPKPKKTLLQRVMWYLVPERHGEFGNTMSEIGYFSGTRWRRLLTRNGWTLTELTPCRLFYTGYSVLGSKLSITWRRRLSLLLGSACNIYVMRKAKRNA